MLSIRAIDGGWWRLVLKQVAGGSAPKHVSAV